MNVLLEFDANAIYGVRGEEDEDIIRQVLKLSEDTWKVPVQLVSDILVVIEVLSIVSVNVTEMDESMDTVVSESAGEVEETEGAVVSNLKA